VNEPVDAIPERVWTSDDHKRLLPLIVGKNVTDATAFIRDTEGVPKRLATKVLNEMEANGMFVIEKQGRSKTIINNELI
jgi:hypothetical protein